MKPKNNDADPYIADPYIIGNGACQGDIAGKVKTRQIGFVRKPVRSKSTVKGRQTNAPNGKQR